eukprot:TRINITY_DN41831_c0_g1_i1.p1 TRINITY_DN41831_c0_g1~~TRINITY_DN41831_c0_g1_i1.p1  ORF type:complete len:556 (+),score=134.22 TRINITY_DN41831_c0_g1_i1:72-1739(+)
MGGDSDDDAGAAGVRAGKRRRTGAAAAGTGTPVDTAAILEGRSVVKLFCRELKPNYSMPWTTKRQHSSSSTAFVLSLEERLLLTNRHCVAHASCVEVRKRGDDQKYEAEVLARGVDCDLALVTVREDAFWSTGLSTQQLRKQVPALFAEVVCVGYPTGGDNLSVTKGVVSRVDYEESADPWRNRLVIQIDAAVNPGNSGGPALVDDGSCVGVAYQSLKDGSTENIGYIIPVSVVEKFLTSWRRSTGAPQGRSEAATTTNGNAAAVAPPQAARVASFGHGRFTAQKLENAGMRRALGMKDGQSGVLVKSVDPTTPNAGQLQSGDVLLALDGVSIGNDGCVPFGCGSTKHDRVPFPYLAVDKFVGDCLEAKVLRPGLCGKAAEEFACQLQLLSDDPVVPFEKESPALLDYVIIGGLVFIGLSQQYLRATFGEKWRKEGCSGLRELMESKARDFSDEQIVVLSYVLAHTVNLGFQDVRNSRLRSVVVKGVSQRVRNLKHMAELIDSSEDDSVIRLELAARGSGFLPGVIVLDRKACKDAEDTILKRNRIPAARHLKSL